MENDDIRMIPQDVAKALVKTGLPALAGMLVRDHGTRATERLVMARRGGFGHREVPVLTDRATELLAADWARSLWVARGSGLVAFNELDDGIVTVTAYDKLPNQAPLWCSTEYVDYIDSLGQAALLAAEAALRASKRDSRDADGESPFMACEDEG